MPEPDGSVGRVEMKGAGGTRELDAAGLAVGFGPDGRPSPIGREEIRDRFGEAIEAAPEEPARFVLLFRSDSTRLASESRKVLPQIVEATKHRPVAEVMVIGRADRSGPHAYNDRLALARARLVRREIVRLGVDADRVEVIALGERKPIVPTKDGVREPKNRRVDVTVR
jgi:outer membrane protein OmpA-like peptidoglycan-associated protein